MAIVFYWKVNWKFSSDIAISCKHSFRLSLESNHSLEESWLTWRESRRGFSSNEVVTVRYEEGSAACGLQEKETDAKNSPAFPGPSGFSNVFNAEAVKFIDQAAGIKTSE
jgi:hypothetical protein